ncbi:hypothetical protein [Staphylococcus hominis]
MKSSNKIKILDKMKEFFHIQAKVPYHFDSIPTINNMNATFYYFEGEREFQDIENLWSLFEIALLYSNNKDEENKINLLESLTLLWHNQELVIVN